MFRLPKTFPGLKDDTSSIVDFFESECLKSEHKRVAFYAIYRSIAPSSDEIEVKGIEDENDDFFNRRFDEVCIEIQRRTKSCAGNYPFVLEEKGYVLAMNSAIDELNVVIYSYLLFATRLNMQKDRTQAKLDGTLLFEKLSAVIAHNYWGERAESLIFGTSIMGGFQGKINELCQRLGEGIRFKNRNEIEPHEKDGRLDIVVWKSFNDGYGAKLIGFGQCKTGLHWENMTTHLQPEHFCNNWLEDSPIVNPVRLFFISDVCPREEWRSKASYAGILFDRFRIMDFLPKTLNESLQKEIRTWVAAAQEFITS